MSSSLLFAVLAARRRLSFVRGSASGVAGIAVAVAAAAAGHCGFAGLQVDSMPVDEKRSAQSGHESA